MSFCGGEICENADSGLIWTPTALVWPAAFDTPIDQCEKEPNSNVILRFRRGRPYHMPVQIESPKRSKILLTLPFMILGPMIPGRGRSIRALSAYYQTNLYESSAVTPLPYYFVSKEKWNPKVSIDPIFTPRNIQPSSSKDLAEPQHIPEEAPTERFRSGSSNKRINFPKPSSIHMGC